ncbi:ABC transporter ATP-binding protein [Rhizobium sp. G21]|uniref:ABC transporter ATP-binding protein n=1 Tax=Rhizobium sp. G21 TaxID=2758439 RepID=UPI001601F232|nr:ABC transporter ATP-binding protein [Rhizobium sp. G21]MBB1248863.1 ABC transporter ATP-binding protein [Rhizobium sp. G21]
MADPLLSLSKIRKVFPGGLVGLDNIDLDIAPGEFLSLLGPSGCGKTTTLRVIAGFESPTSGSVRLEGRDITPLRPYDRPVNTVFQDYALFPHMDVTENIAFGLSLRKIPSAERRKKVQAALEMVGLPDKAEARVGALSGGQRQRVALARAIVCEPKLLLLDEPLSALDAHLREQMQVELKRLQHEIGATFVMVTHDQTEALSISDRIVVMNKGRIEQAASPAELYDRPATRFVAGFIGTMNLLPARVVGVADSDIRIDVDGWSLTIPSDGAPAPRPGDDVTIGVRPEDLFVSRDAGAGDLLGTAVSVVFHGKSLRLRVETSRGKTLSVDVPRQGEQNIVEPGATVALSLRPGAACPLMAG